MQVITAIIACKQHLRDVVTSDKCTSNQILITTCNFIVNKRAPPGRLKPLNLGQKEIR